VVDEVVGIQQGKAYCQTENFQALAEEAECVSVQRRQIGRAEGEQAEQGPGRKGIILQWPCCTQLSVLAGFCV